MDKKVSVIETTLLPRSIGTKELVYQDKFQQLHRIVAEFDGFTKEYYVADRGRRAGLLALRNDDVLLVKQYRLLINGLSLEIPGGRVDEGEAPEAAAYRECLEETGMQCFNLRPLISYQPGLDALRNPTSIYLSEKLEERARDKAERRVWIPLSRCIDMVFSREIVDSLSIIALLSYRVLASKR